MFIAALAVLLGAAQAEPLDPDISCILGRIPSSVQDAALAEAATGEGAAIRQAFHDATDACAQERSWSPEFTTDAGQIAVALAIGQQAQATLQGNGISPDLVHEWFDARPAAVRQNVGDGVQLLANHLQASGVSVAQLETNAQTLGQLLGAMSVIERTCRRARVARCPLMRRHLPSAGANG